MANKIAVFILEDYFNKENFVNLGACLSSSGTNVFVVSSKKNANLVSEDRKIKVKSAASYTRTDVKEPDLFALVDENICEKCPDQVPALLKKANNEGKLILTVGHTIEALIKADIVQNKKVAAPTKLKKELQELGATVTGSDIEVDGNLITVKKENMQEVCNIVTKKLGLKAA